MELGVHSGFNFIWVGDSVMIHFPRKRSLSVSTTCAIWPQNREAKKIGSLKYFEIYGVYEKEPPISKLTYFSYYQSD
jgi:hypothetical protein